MRSQIGSLLTTLIPVVLLCGLGPLPLVNLESLVVLESRALLGAVLAHLMRWMKRLRRRQNVKPNTKKIQIGNQNKVIMHEITSILIVRFVVSYQQSIQTLPWVWLSMRCGLTDMLYHVGNFSLRVCLNNLYHKSNH